MSPPLSSDKRTQQILEIFCLKLTGIYGLYSDAINNPEVKPTFDPIDGDQWNLAWSIECPYFLEYIVHLDFRKNRITNHLIVASDKGRNNGTVLRCLEDQMSHAAHVDFKVIITKARRDDASPYIKKDTFTKCEWTGYNVWGKYGFLMNPSQNKKFVALMETHGIQNIKHIDEIYYGDDNKATAQQIWKIHGEPWRGTFYLTGNPRSRIVFSKLKYSISKRRANN